MSECILNKEVNFSTRYLSDCASDSINRRFCIKKKHTWVDIWEIGPSLVEIFYPRDYHHYLLGKII